MDVWGGRDSNPRPSDYEVLRPHRCAESRDPRHSGRRQNPYRAESSSVNQNLLLGLTRPRSNKLTCSTPTNALQRCASRMA
jgi:hypothetical protein